jgi:hypothetical protein
VTPNASVREAEDGAEFDAGASARATVSDQLAASALPK